MDTKITRTTPMYAMTNTNPTVIGITVWNIAMTPPLTEVKAAVERVVKALGRVYAIKYREIAIRITVTIIPRPTSITLLAALPDVGPNC